MGFLFLVGFLFPPFFLEVEEDSSSIIGRECAVSSSLNILGLKTNSSGGFFDSGCTGCSSAGVSFPTFLFFVHVNNHALSTITLSSHIAGM